MKKNESVTVVKKTYDTYKNDDKKLISELKKLARQGQKSGDVLMVGAVYCYLADVFRKHEDTEGIMTNALKAVEMLKDSDQYEMLVKAHIALSYVYGQQDNHQMTLAECDKAYRIIKRHRLKGRTRIVVLNNMANCYHYLGDYKTSIKLLNECAKRTAEEFPEDYSSAAMHSINLASNYKYDGAKEKARLILDSMEKWIDKVKFLPLVCDYHLRRAILCYELGDAEKGDEYMDNAFGCVPDNVYPQPLYDDLRQVSHVLVERKDKARADKIMELMTVYAEKNKETIEQLYAYRMMADYYDGFGESEQALQCFRKLDLLYEKRMDELTHIQSNIYKSMKNADIEIGKLKRSMRETEELYSLEPMTKLLNRAALLRVSSDFISAAAKKKQKIGAIFIDIDFFKECNDTYGHAKGDDIIREVAAACKAEEASNVRFARYGGDEFFGITRGLSDADVADIARRICRRIKKADIPHEKNPNGHRITLSAGVVNVMITDRTDTIIEIANYADKAVYYAKNAGKNAIYLLDHDRSGKNGKTAEFIKINF